jgi:hypothetical protein
MAISPVSSYPAQVNTTDPTGYPYGRARNVSAIGDGTGTPLEEQWVSDLFGFQQALLSAAGLTPSGSPDKVGASQYLDALKTVSRRAEQLHDAFRFTRTDLGVGSSSLTRLSAVQQTGGIGAPVNRQKSILVSGASSGGLAQSALLNDGTNPPLALNSLAGSALTSAPASDSFGVFFAGLSAGSAIKSPDGGSTSSAVTVTGASTQLSWVGCTASHYLAFERSTSKLYVSTALGGTWTSTTLGTIADIVNDLITDGAGTWVLIVTGVGGATYALQSVDDGASWASVSIAGSANGAGGAWSADWQRFVVIDGLGKLWSSPDGATWTLVKTMAALASGTLVTGFGQNTVAACGPAIACVANRGANSLGKYAQGIAYTLDRGANWNEVYIGATTNKPITNLIAANGRLFAIDGSNLYQGGVLIAPPSLFTGV